ncbi:putative sporulation protein YtxC [Paenibacillus doosanensis]|uniref:YtxC-like family protein n=1 Tax=Paenibacillus konkukensis TaxID=2020716 RepID=A0ABY4RW70_9BACL|nr:MULTISPECIES: putative sporulation protein YtxC [Paenibacillus]MCS7462751.1 putative sporulation protein YtxC [Paenibacillus doosanensis]UQZ86014.1 YtxC-like family protein [Paenibacillus konkukensis]
MKLFALTVAKMPDDAVQRLRDAVEQAARQVYKSHLAVHVQRFGACSTILAEGIFPRFQLDRRTDTLYSKTADALAEWIIHEEEEGLLRSLIARHYEYKKDEEIRSILSYCLPGAFGEAGEPPFEQTFSRRKQIIAQAVFEYLQEHTDLNLEGFIHFRLHDYMEELHEMVEYAVDEFLMDQQYQEFISLLKYFVYIQEAKIPVAHLIHKGGNEFALLNDSMEPIDTSENDATVTVEMLEKDINFEDVIVSTLISVSPQQIYIHTRDPEVQVIKTIKQIFENRVQLCDYCGLCHNLDRSAAADYNKG